MLMIHFCLLKTNKSRVIMTKYDSILLPNTYIISKHSANTTLYHLLSSLNLTLLFVFRFCDQNCFRSRVPTVSLTIGPDHTPILVCHSIISKNKLQIFLSQRLWLTKTLTRRRSTRRSGLRLKWSCNEAWVDRHNLSQGQSVFITPPPTPPNGLIKPYIRQNYHPIYFSFIVATRLTV